MKARTPVFLRPAPAGLLSACLLLGSCAVQNRYIESASVHYLATPKPPALRDAPGKAEAAFFLEGAQYLRPRLQGSTRHFNEDSAMADTRLEPFEPPDVNTAGRQGNYALGMAEYVGIAGADLYLPHLLGFHLFTGMGRLNGRYEYAFGTALSLSFAGPSFGLSAKAGWTFMQYHAAVRYHHLDTLPAGFDSSRIVETRNIGPETEQGRQSSLEATLWLNPDVFSGIGPFLTVGSMKVGRGLFHFGLWIGPDRFKEMDLEAAFIQAGARIKLRERVGFLVYGEGTAFERFERKGLSAHARLEYRIAAGKNPKEF